jgi:RecJ-like exonuclease
MSKIVREERCAPCKGTGIAAKSDPSEKRWAYDLESLAHCLHCDGTGRVMVSA